MGVFSHDPDFCFARWLNLTRAGIHFDKAHFSQVAIAAQAQNSRNLPARLVIENEHGFTRRQKEGNFSRQITTGALPRLRWRNRYFPTKTSINPQRTFFWPGGRMLVNNSYHDVLPYVESYYHQRFDVAFTPTETE